MALIKCKSCGNEISKNAKLCPSCGEPAKQKTSFVTWGVLIIILLAVYGGATTENIGNRSKKSVELTEEVKAEIKVKAERRVEESFRRDLIYKAEKKVKSLMKDSRSTKFKNVLYNETKKGGAVVCGLYSSKNSFGAYSGFQRFISNGKTTFLEEKDKNIADVWVEVCLKEK